MAELSLKDLWQACGGSGELRLLIEHPSRPPRGAVVETPFALLGSADLGAVVLPDEQVSRRHACLQVIGGQLWCFDLVSRTGTFWGNRRKNAGWFDAAQSIRIGPYQLRVFPEQHAAERVRSSPFRPLPLEQDSLPSATLEFLNAHRAGSTQIPTIHLDRPLTLVGQSPRCKIRFTCPTVSTCHCSLLRTPHGIWVIDLQSREGVSVNGARVRWARLRDGDCLGIGRFEVLVHVVPRRIPATSSLPPMVESSTASRPPEPAVAAPVAGPPAAAPALGISHTATPTTAKDVDTAPASTALASSALATTASSGALATVNAGNAALVPTNLSAMAPTAGGDATGTLLLTFVNQFSMMQQQMFEQFQQTTMMMMQMFGTLQRDQLQLVRQELDSLRDLNREIVALQAELAMRQADGRADRRPAAAAAESKPPAPRPLAAAGSPSSGLPSSGSPKPPPLADKKAAGAAPTANGMAPPDDDVHAWLSQRFNHLQQESKTRWQKLLATVVGH